MLRFPNDTDTFGALTESFDLYKSLAGNGYARWKPNGDTINLWRLRPDRTKPVPDKRGHIAEFEYNVDGKPERFPAEEIMHFKFFDPGVDHLGLAPLQAAARIVDTSNAAIDHNMHLVGNRARPSGMIVPKNDLTDEQFLRWQENIKNNMAGAKNAGKVTIQPFSSEFVPFELTPAALDYLKSFDTYEAAICKAFHVHPEAIGALGATFENKEWAIRAKWQGPVTSRLNEMRAVMNHKFRPLFGTADPKVAQPGDLFLDYDLSDTPLAEYQQGKALERVEKAWGMGMSFNQAADEFGLGVSEVEGGDVGYIDARKLPVGTEPSSGGQLSRMTRATGANIWQENNRKIEGWARGVSVKVSDVFTSQRKVCVEAVQEGHVDLDIFIEQSTGRWTELITAVMRAVIEDFGEETAESLNPSLSEVGRARLRAVEALSEHRPETRMESDFDPWNELTQEWVTTQTAEDVAAIQITTKKAIRKTVLAGLDEGESMVQIAKRVKEEFKKYEDGVSSYRAMMIARTEVHNAAAFAMHESARQSGVAQEKHWLDAGDERVRDTHAANTAEGWIPFDAAYSNGAMYPGGEVHCRCVEMYRSTR